MRSVRLTLMALALTLLPAEGLAQSATSTARSAALAQSYTARARGWESALFNPANLGLSDRPRYSVGIVGVTAYIDNDALSYGELADIYGKHLDDQQKSEILAKVRDAPGSTFEWNVDLGGSALGFSIGRFALGLSTAGAGEIAASADAVELLLFGNAGEDGTGKEFNLQGSEAEAWYVTQAYVAYGQPFTISALDPVKFSAGATLKYGVAHGYLRALDRGSLFVDEPLAIAAEAEAYSSNETDIGRAWGIDLGIAAEWERLVASIVLQNAFADIVWDEGIFERTLLGVQSDFESTSTVDETIAFADLDPEDQERLKQALDGANPAKRLKLGAAYQIHPKLSLSADYLDLIGGTLSVRWDHTLAFGAEYVPLTALPLRVGFATDLSRIALTGGLGVHLKAFQLDFAVGRYGLLEGNGATLSLTLGIRPRG